MLDGVKSVELGTSCVSRASPSSPLFLFRPRPKSSLSSFVLFRGGCVSTSPHSHSLQSSCQIPGRLQPHLSYRCPLTRLLHLKSVAFASVVALGLVLALVLVLVWHCLSSLVFPWPLSNSSPLLALSFPKNSFALELTSSPSSFGSSPCRLPILWMNRR